MLQSDSCWSVVDHPLSVLNRSLMFLLKLLITNYGIGIKPEVPFADHFATILPIPVNVRDVRVCPMQKLKRLMVKSKLSGMSV